jgi:pimeloyl-ACP methyl ester carboxylesterase
MNLILKNTCCGSILLAALYSLFSCSIAMTEKSVIFDDEGITPISESFEYYTKEEFPDYNFARIEVIHSDNVKTRGVHLSKPSNKVNLIYYGGNLFTIERHAPYLLPKLIKLNVNIFWFDHRGRGSSEGAGTVVRMRQDALEQFDYVVSQTGNKPIVVHGVSLGSFMAGHIVGKRNVAGLVLEASSTNVDDLIESIMPRYLSPFLSVAVEDTLRIPDNSSVVKNSSVPLLIMVGELDKTTPPYLSKKLYEQSGAKLKRLVIASGALHGNALSHDGTLQQYQIFLDEIQHLNDLKILF